VAEYRRDNQVPMSFSINLDIEEGCFQMNSIHTWKEKVCRLKLCRRHSDEIELSDAALQAVYYQLVSSLTIWF